MARCTSVDTNPHFLSVDLARQLLPGRIERALNLLLDHEVDPAHFNALFRRDTTGATPYLPAMLPTALFAFFHDNVRRRAIERVSPRTHDIDGAVRHNGAALHDHRESWSARGSCTDLAKPLIFVHGANAMPPRRTWST